MDELVTLTLPYPPSTNRYWRTFRGRTVPSKEAATYKRLVQQIGPSWTGQQPELYKEDVAITIHLLPKMTTKGVASKVCIDLDNCLKVLLDAIQGTWIADDKQVKKIVAEYGQPVHDGGVIITICKMN